MPGLATQAGGFGFVLTFREAVLILGVSIGFTFLSRCVTSPTLMSSILCMLGHIVTDMGVDALRLSITKQFVHSFVACRFTTTSFLSLYF